MRRRAHDAGSPAAALLRRARRRGQDHSRALAGCGTGRSFERESPRVLCLMTQRRRLDAFLVEQAVAAGAEFRDGVQVTIDSETELRVDGKPVEVGALIGADGANGITARSLGLGGAIVNGVALEGNLPVRGAPARRMARDVRPRAQRCARRLRLDLPEGRPRQRRRRRLGPRRPATAPSPPCPLRPLRHRAPTADGSPRASPARCGSPERCSHVVVLS